MHVIEILLPVFFVVLLGAVLARTGFLSVGNLGELNRLVYWIGLPAFLFESVARAEFGSGALPVSAVIIAATLAVGVLAYAVAMLRGLPWASVGTFVQAATRGNIAYVGLPVIALAVQQAGPDAAGLKTLALLAMAPTIVVFNVIGIMALAGSSQGFGPAARKAAVIQLLTNPLVIALLLGVLVSSSGLSLPRGIWQSVFMVGQMALPLALLCIGGALVTSQIQGRRVSSVLASVLKVAVAPAVGYLIARVLGLGADETRLALIFLATPTAAASYVVAGKLGGDMPLAAGTVVLSTLFCVLPLAVILALA